MLRTQRLERSACKFIERDGLEGAGVLSRFHRGERQQLPDKRIESLGLPLDPHEMLPEFRGRVLTRQSQSDD